VYELSNDDEAMTSKFQPPGCLGSKVGKDEVSGVRGRHYRSHVDILLSFVAGINSEVGIMRVTTTIIIISRMNPGLVTADSPASHSLEVASNLLGR